MTLQFEAVTAFPARVVDYLARLPDGLDSYPAAQVKNSVVRAWIAEHDTKALAAAVPETVRPLCTGELMVTRWVPEVHATAVYLTLRELFFDSDAAFVLDAHARNRALLSGRLYRMLVRLLSVERIGKTTRLLYSQMHRGTDLSVDVTDFPWRCWLRYPHALVPELLGHCYATAIGAAVELSGMHRVEVETVSVSDTELRLAVSFDR